MKSIKAATNPKDRVVCVTTRGAHKFYYQPYKSNKRLYLFETDDFSGSVFAYFRDNGRCLSERGFSLTIKELYEDRKMYRNPKVGKIFDRLPRMIDYVICENSEEIMNNKHINTIKKENEVIYDDFILVA